MRRHYWFTAALLTSFILTACLRGETITDGANGTGDGNGNDNSGVTSVGTVTQFGSIFVNGIEYGTNSTNFTLDGTDNGLETGLETGMVVTVGGFVNSDNLTGTANTINYTPDLRGPVVTPSALEDGGTFNIFGQDVVADETTVYDSARGFASITAGLNVEVSGYRNATDHKLHATKVKSVDQNAGFISTGAISGVTPTAFTLGALSVNYVNSVRTNFPAGGLNNGLFVRVRASVAPVGGILTATSVDVLPSGVGALEGQQVHVQGFISGSVPNRFSVNGQTVSTSTATTYQNGAATNLVDGAKVEIEGIVSSDVLAAAKVRFQQVSDVSLDVPITLVNITDNTVTVLGTSGIVIKVDRNTLLDDRRGAVHDFNLSDLSANNRISVAGKKENGANSLVAVRLTRINDSTGPVSLKGPVNSATNPTLTILGIAADTSDPTVQFEDANGNAILQGDFFNLITAGTKVRVDGVFNGSAISVTHAKIEN
ncbi:MAG: DUF5666 domain-containing protein [Pseudomonadota bacterium]